MRNRDISLLFDFNYWARDRILESCDRLNADQLLAQTPISFGSIRNALVHILNAEWIWRLRCQQRVSPSSMLKFDDFPSIHSIRNRWQEEETAFRRYLESLDEADLEQIVPYRRTGGQPNMIPHWQILVHVVLHGVEHRGEVARAITRYGFSPGDMDLIHFLRR